MEVRVINNQSLLDIAVQEYGTAEAAFAIAVANDMDVTDVLVPGMKLNLNLKMNGERNEVAEYFNNRRLFPATAIVEMHEKALGTYSDENYVEQNYW